MDSKAISAVAIVHDWLVTLANQEEIAVIDYFRDIASKRGAGIGYSSHFLTCGTVMLYMCSNSPSGPSASTPTCHQLAISLSPIIMSHGQP